MYEFILCECHVSTSKENEAKFSAKGGEQSYIKREFATQKRFLGWYTFSKFLSWGIFIYIVLKNE